MSTDKTSKETVKLVVVIALSVVAAVMAYFRFIRKPADSTPPEPDTAAGVLVLAIPDLPDWLVGGVVLDIADSTPYRPPIRDLFAPVIETNTVIAPPRQDYAPRLTGIIQGGAPNALAVIDGRIVRAGQQFGKYTVLEIRPHAVVLQDGDTRTVLPMGKTLP